MSQGFATFLLMNNYFHDVATAMLLACSVVLWVVLKHLDGREDAGALRIGGALFRGITAVFRASVVWIVASGIIRLATLREFEWHNFSEKHFESGLIVKYVIALIMMAVGAVLWRRLARAMRRKLGT